MITHLFFDQPNLYIDWQLGNVCNYNCYYCNDDSKLGNYRWPSYEKCTTLVDKILEHSVPIHGYRTYNLLGGEPTIWKDFGKLCKYIKEKDKNSIIQILTNGSRTTRWWEENKTFLDKVVISYHNNTAEPEHIVEVVNILKEYVAVSIQVLMDAKNFDDCKNTFHFFINSLPGVKVGAKKLETVLGSGEYMEYTEEQNMWMQWSGKLSRDNEIFKIEKKRDSEFKRILFLKDKDGVITESSNKEIINANLNNFKNFKCKIGIDMLSIKANGNITPSSACFTDKIMGNYLLGTDIKWFTEPFTCIYDKCFCGADIEIEKYEE